MKALTAFLLWSRVLFRGCRPAGARRVRVWRSGQREISRSCRNRMLWWSGTARRLTPTGFVLPARAHYSLIRPPLCITSAEAVRQRMPRIGRAASKGSSVAPRRSRRITHPHTSFSPGWHGRFTHSHHGFTYPHACVNAHKRVQFHSFTPWFHYLAPWKPDSPRTSFHSFAPPLH